MSKRTINIKAQFNIVISIPEGADVDEVVKSKVDWMGESDHGSAVIAMRPTNWCKSPDQLPEQEEVAEKPVSAECGNKGCTYHKENSCQFTPKCKRRVIAGNNSE